MRQIRVLLVHRDNDTYRHLTGWWSYAVNEFTWDALKVVPQDFTLDLVGIGHNYDMVVLDDWIFGQIKNRHIPLAYVVVDSARSAAQFKRNALQAAQADLVLVDSDALNKFSGLKPARRFAYAVNEQLFFPHPKEYDVAFLCWPTPPRREVQAQCANICERHGWRFLTGTYGWQDYARLLSSAKIVVHKAHVAEARSWRVFDVMAARGCLLSSPLPTIAGDGIEAGKHYAVYHDAIDLETQLMGLLDSDNWKNMAEAGYEHVILNHTWQTRAAQLRETVDEVFKWAN